MDTLTSQTHAAKHEAQQVEGQLRAATQQLTDRAQEITLLKVRSMFSVQTCEINIDCLQPSP